MTGPAGEPGTAPTGEPTPAAAASELDVLRATEQWFRRRGLPYFVPEDRAGVRTALAPRALAPLAVAVVLAGLLLGGVLTWQTESASLGPGVLTFLVLLAAGLYAVTRLGARPIMVFAGHRTVAGLGGIFPMAARALPLLLVFVTFLFINAEVWMLSANLDGGLLWLTVLLFAAFAVGFLLVRLPEEVDRLDDRLDGRLLVTASRATPIGEAAQALVDAAGGEPDLREDAEVRGYERGNLIVVLLVIQAAQVLLLALSVFAFFMLFGALTMNQVVQETWIAGATHHVSGVDNVSVELFQVSVFLAAFSGLYFTVYVVTDETYREQFFAGVLRELEQAVAVRTAYRLVRRRREASDGPGATTAVLPATAEEPQKSD